MSDSMQYYLQDCMKELAEMARSAKAEAESTKSDYDLGKLMAYYTVISYLQQQANAFYIPLEKVGLDGIAPDTDLL